MGDMPNLSNDTVLINNVIQMPVVGFGTYRIKKADIIKKSIDAALAAGYRMFDTSSPHGNEAAIRQSFDTLLVEYNLKREDIFLSSKLYFSNKSIEEACKRSIQNLGVEYIDLFLLHLPSSEKFRTLDDEHAKMRRQAWADMTKLYNEGLVLAIGVSNYSAAHISELMEHNPGVVTPAVNQVEYQPFYQPNKCLSVCREYNIPLQAYGVIGAVSGSDNSSVLSHPKIVEIARRLRVSPAQVLLAWVRQQDITVLAKSTNPEHVQQNYDLTFRLSNEDIKNINKLGRYANETEMSGCGTKHA